MLPRRVQVTRAPVSRALHGQHRAGAGASAKPLCCRCQSTSGEEVAAPAAEDVVWDPKGILGDASPSVGLIERKLAARQVAQAKDVSGRPVLSISPEALAAGGWNLDEGTEQLSKAEFAALLADSFMPTNLDTPGLRVLSISPPVMVIDNFLDAETCSAFVNAARACDALQPSQIGVNKLGDASNAASHRRTSTSLLLDKTAQQQYPTLRGISASVQERVRTLLPGGVWGTVGKPPARDAFCFEALQAAHYAPGEHFLAHEDAFPTVMLPETGFQRRATVLVYLNDCTAGGRTAFEALDGVSVQPAAGRALLFYPAFKDGTPDARTLHSGGDAGDEKWVVQQWVACGTKGAKATPLGLGGMGPGLTSRPGKSLSSLMGGKGVGPGSVTSGAAGGSKLDAFIKDVAHVGDSDIDLQEHLRQRRRKQKGKVKAPPKPKTKGFGGK